MTSVYSRRSVERGIRPTKANDPVYETPTPPSFLFNLVWYRYRPSGNTCDRLPYSSLSFSLYRSVSSGVCSFLVADGANQSRGTANW